MHRLPIEFGLILIEHFPNLMSILAREFVTALSDDPAARVFIQFEYVSPMIEEGNLFNFYDLMGALAADEADAVDEERAVEAVELLVLL